MKRFPLFVLSMLFGFGCGESDPPTAAPVDGERPLAASHEGTLPVAWVDQFGGASFDFGFASAADATGVYASGGTSADLAAPHLGGVDAYLRKYDHSGNVLWTDQFGTPHLDAANGVASDGSAVYLAGATRGDLEDPTTGILPNDGFLRKYDAAGKHSSTRSRR